ncbi:hypothetical protein FSP39_001243 [Pinctada imbricata]|uniref:t-SNARE coiled-coil homology domain-containing protein n=1 Tax=Pinctada imbricata TaxID=66713 RepID=A0AA88XUZ4_PINIB|nr:hypothetical protein FSP39_001243 [Pinctada imbricata]
MSARRRRTNSGSEKSYDSNGYISQRNQTYVVENPHTISKDPEMSCRDRSGEFMSAVKLLQSRQGNGVPPHKQNASLRHRSEFTQIAKRIGRDLANTFAKLEKLTILAKKKSLFDDKPVEIQELTYIIKQDINSLNKQIAHLQELAKASRSQNGRHIQGHSNSVVFSLQNLKEQKSRREQFSQPLSMPTSAFGDKGSVLFQDEMNHSQGAMGGSGEVVLNLDGMDRDKYQEQLQLIDEQDSYIQDRAETMQNIESTIVELGSIFQQLAHMVKEQEETVQRQLRNLLKKGPKYRIPSKIDFIKCREELKEALDNYTKRWCKSEGVESHSLNDWKNLILDITDIRIDNFHKNPHLFENPSSKSERYFKSKLRNLHEKYVFAPADKAANNTIII